MSSSMEGLRQMVGVYLVTCDDADLDLPFAHVAHMLEQCLLMLTGSSLE